MQSGLEGGQVIYLYSVSVHICRKCLFLAPHTVSSTTPPLEADSMFLRDLKQDVKSKKLLKARGSRAAEKVIREGFTFGVGGRKVASVKCQVSWPTNF